MRKNGQSEYVRKEASAGWVMVHHGLIPPKLTCISITCAVVKNTCMSIYNRKFRITAKVSASRYIFITNVFKQGSMLTVLADMLFDILAVSIHWRACWNTNKTLWNLWTSKSRQKIFIWIHQCFTHRRASCKRPSRVCCHWRSKPER